MSMDIADGSDDFRWKQGTIYIPKRKELEEKRYLGWILFAFILDLVLDYLDAGGALF
jgi:hypothetical protein